MILTSSGPDQHPRDNDPGNRVKWSGNIQSPPTSSPCSPLWPPLLAAHHHLLWTPEDEQRGNSTTPGRRGSFWQSCLLLELLKERDLPKPPHLHPDPWERWWKSPWWQSISKLRWCIRWLPSPLQIPSTLLRPLWTLQTVLDGLLCLLPSSCLEGTTRREEAGRRDRGIYFPQMPPCWVSEGWLVTSLNHKSLLLSRCPLHRILSWGSNNYSLLLLLLACGLPILWLVFVNHLLNPSHFTQSEGAICFLPGSGMIQMACLTDPIDGDSKDSLF